METQTTNQWQCDHGQWPEANVGQQYRKGPDLLVHQILTVPTTINPEKWPAVGSRPGPILTFQDLRLTSTNNFNLSTTKLNH